jgi:predicted Zn-dependent protease
MSNGAKGRLVIALLLAAGSLAAYWMRSDENPVTGETQRVAMTQDEEIALGVQAEPELVRQHGGLEADPAARARVERIGRRLLDGLTKTLEKSGRSNPYPFEFHLLADDRTVNAFALPGGQVFITDALYRRLATDGQVAGVLGHEIGHVLSRHGAQRLAKERLNQGLAGAAGVAGGTQSAADMARQVAALVSLSYGRDAELESDRWGVRLAASAGYDPRAMLGVIDVLDSLSRGNDQPEMLATHPKPANRAAYVNEVLADEFPDGVPAGLEP